MQQNRLKFYVTSNCLEYFYKFLMFKGEIGYVYHKHFHITKFKNGKKQIEFVSPSLSLCGRLTFAPRLRHCAKVKNQNDRKCEKN